MAQGDAGSIALWMEDLGVTGGEQGHTRDRTKGTLSPKGMLTPDSPVRREMDTGLKGNLCFGSCSSGSDQGTGFCVSPYQG